MSLEMLSIPGKGFIPDLCASFELGLNNVSFQVLFGVPPTIYAEEAFTVFIAFA